MLWPLTIFRRRSLGIKKKKVENGLGRKKERRILSCVLTAFNSYGHLNSTQLQGYFFIHTICDRNGPKYNYQIHDYCWNPKTKVTPKEKFM